MIQSHSRSKLLRSSALLLFLSLALAGCAQDDDDPAPGECAAGETDACLCADATFGEKSCVNGSWGACACGDDPGTFHHGDICLGPDWDCGSELICIVDNQGDTQGVCRAICESPSDCIDNDDALDRLDTQCCDIVNGSRVCGQQTNWPASTCE